jgi:Ca2+-binding RTX toxin-like protein
MQTTLIRVLATLTGVLLSTMLATAPAHAGEPAPEETLCKNPAAIVGTPGDDVLEGTEGDDVICGFGGDDILIGDDGNDVLIGGSGDDTLVGGSGSDRLFGGDGDDRLVDTREPGFQNGGNGADRCFGAAGTVFTECERVIRIGTGTGG